MRIKLGFILLLLMVKLYLPAQTSIGGNLNPLKYSIHTYSIKMSSPDYTYEWGIYPYGTTKDQIEKGLVVPLLGNGIDYTSQGISNDAVNSYFKVQFDGGLAYSNGVGTVGHYIIGFRERTKDFACLGASLQEIVLYAPFDVDISLPATENPTKCAGGSDVFMIGAPSSQTASNYTIAIEFPHTPDTYINGGAVPWTFDFQVKINDGVLNSTNSKIVSINASGTGYSQGWPTAAGSSNFFGSCSVTPSQTSPITFIVVYQDVVGVPQNVLFNISNILGVYKEMDIDEKGGFAGNSLSQTILAMPNVGVIEPLN
jgi:hypothetical protein